MAKRKDMVFMCVAPLGGKRAVGVGVLPDDIYVVEFTRPIERHDFRNGKPVTQAVTVRRKNKIVTQIRISKDGAIALERLLKKMVKEPTFMELFRKNMANSMMAAMYTLAEMNRWQTRRR